MSVCAKVSGLEVTEKFVGGVVWDGVGGFQVNAERLERRTLVPKFQGERREEYRSENNVSLVVGLTDYLMLACKYINGTNSIGLPSIFTSQNILIKHGKWWPKKT